MRAPPIFAFTAVRLGAASKTWGLLLDALRWHWVPGYTATLFRRTMPQITNPGGMWDESFQLYNFIEGAKANHSLHRWQFPTRGAPAIIDFSSLTYETSIYEWQGAQIATISFDELTHFSESMFFYMLSRNRSVCGVKPYIRAATNPDVDSWVADFISWWIDQETGYPILERAGVMRWFVRVEDEIMWGDNPEALLEDFPRLRPKSLTFIPADIYDNPALLAKDPNYEGNLMALSYVERERLLKGNWKIKPAAGYYFKRHWFKLLDREPAEIVQWVRFWDLAATEPAPGADPDYTVGVKMGRTGWGEQSEYVILDVVRDRLSPAATDDLIHQTARLDGPLVSVRWEEEGGAAGKRNTDQLARRLRGFDARGVRPEGNKESRAKTLSADSEHGYVSLLAAPWADAFLGELEYFPQGAHDDQVDAAVGAHAALLEDSTLIGAGYTPYS